jgi:uncharacterized protein YecE (DUF72 family)
MARRLHIAAKQLSSSLSAYAKRFDYLEVHMPASGADAVPTPFTPASLRRWRKQVPPHFDFGVVLGPHASSLRASPKFEDEVTFALEAAAALEAHCILIRTPRDVTPAQLHRDRLARLCARFPRDVTHLVWEPQGVWETDDAAVVAKKLELVLAVDPTRDPVPAGPVAYLRLRALGETRSFGRSALERIVESLGVARRDVYVVIETASALAECKLLRSIGSRMSTGREGGMTRLVRPRPAMVRVKDDEQE